MNTFETEYIETRRRVIEKNFPNLNPEQRKAVMATEGPLLILAGAGSGKTTVLINRIANIMKYGSASDSSRVPEWASQAQLDTMKAYLAGDETLKPQAETAAALDPVEPWKILAITFTNKAAGELKDRLHRMLGERADDIWARTFHSACVRILRRDADKLGYSNDFTIYDTGDRQAVMKRIVKERGMDEKMYPTRYVFAVIDKAKDDLKSPTDLATEAEARGDIRLKGVAELYGEYQRRLKHDGAMDFEDLIYLTVRLLKENAEVLDYYQHKFSYVLIDEYQDTNNLQYLLASMLADGHKNICVVGDDDQSIYAFRGATIENILSFEDQYAHARVFRLEQNYRSSGHILAAANGVVANNRDRKGKKLWTRAGEGEPVQLYIAKNENDEADFIVRTILDARLSGRPLRDNAVLYRLNAQSRVLEQTFLRNGIRPRIVKGNPFFERAEIKDIMAYFFVMLNPSDELRLTRIINVPARGIGTTTIGRIQTLAAQSGMPMIAVMARAAEFPELKAAVRKLAEFTGMLNDLYRMAPQMGLEELYDELMERTGYIRRLEEEHTEESLNRIENIKELKSFIVSHIHATGDNTLAGFLDEVSLYTDLQQMDEDQDTVTMMTIHSAKGLEFPCVFIAGMDEGVFPSLQAIGEQKQMEEERRLAYVAITRAKEELYITSARQRMVFGQTASHRVSRFVDEIPNEHIERPERDLRPSYFDFDDIPRERPAQPKPKKPEPVRLHGVSGTAKKSAALPAFAPGDKVNHKAFGIGVIQSMQPMGGDALVEIEFADGVHKRLMLRAAAKFMEKI